MTEKVELENLVSWSEHSDNGVKYFSGSATYRKVFELSEGTSVFAKADLKHEPMMRVMGQFDIQSVLHLPGDYVSAVPESGRRRHRHPHRYILGQNGVYDR